MSNPSVFPLVTPGPGPNKFIIVPTISALLIILLIDILITLNCSRRHFPTLDEARQIPAGLDHWKTGTFRTANDIPPLARMIASLPIFVLQPHLVPYDEFRYPVSGLPDVSRDATPELTSRPATVDLKRFLTLAFRARLAGILWWGLGAWLVLRWAWELYGERAGWFAMILWGFGPNILAREQVATPDLPTAVACLAATYVYWHWLRSPSWVRAALAGILLGVAQLTEFAALVLYIAWPVMGAVSRLVRGRGVPTVGVKTRAGQVALGLVLSIGVVNLGYGFSRSGLPLKDFRFASHALGGGKPLKYPWEEGGGNRFRATWLSGLPVPVPADYLNGIDLRWRDAEVRPQGEVGTSEMLTDRGKFSPATLLARVPLGTWVLLLGALALTLVHPPGRSPLADELVLWAPVAIIPAVALSRIGFLLSMPVMLVLPASFALIGVGKLARFLRSGHWRVGGLITALLVWAVASGLASIPYPLYYLNEVAGGRSDVAAQVRHALPGDGGQDLSLLKGWTARHPETRTLSIACRHVLELRAYGIIRGKGVKPPAISAMPPAVSRHGTTDYREYTYRGGPYPGYYAIDCYNLKNEKFGYFRKLTPVIYLGASILVYHVTPEADERIRRQAGLASNGDLLALKGWLREHPEASPIGLACSTVTDPGSIGIDSTVPPPNPGPAPANAPWYTPRVGPHPGYYALDLQNLKTEQYEYFMKTQPIFRAGSSILIYHITREDADRMRQRSGLPPLERRPPSRMSAKEHGFFERVHRDPEGANFNYGLFVPSDYSGDRPYPVILFLQGYGERAGGKTGKDYLRLTFPPAVTRRRDTFGFIAICPQGRSGDWKADGADARAAMDILALVEKQYNVDPKRIYLTGVSTGGAGVWDLAAADPDRWAAIVPVSTTACNPGQAGLIAKIPCWCFHNAHDDNNPPAGPRGMIAALRKAGGAPRYTEFTMLRTDLLDRIPWHNAWDKAYNMPQLYEWLIQQSRP